MTQDNSTEASEATGESGSDENSPIIRELRQQIKEMQRELKAVPNRTELEAELRAQVRRESAIEAELVHFGHPAGIRSVVEDKLGDAEVTRESVAAALKAVGYEVTADDSDSDGPSVEANSALEGVTQLSSQVQSAAQKKGTEDFYDGLNKTDTPAELAAYMREKGLGS